MKRLIVFVALMIVISMGIVFASGIDGKWIGSIEGPQGDMQIAFHFKTHGDTLTGTVVTMMGEMPVTPAKIIGNQFAFDVDAQGMFVSHQCTLMGDSILMRYCMMEMDTMEVMLYRQK